MYVTVAQQQHRLKYLTPPNFLRGDVMDKLEQSMQQMAQMTEEDRMKMIESKKKLCICGGCPIYNDRARKNKDLLEDFGVPKRQIKKEDFPGY